MDFKVFLSLLLLGLIIFMGCTACDSENGNSIDFTRDEGVLTYSLGWDPQQKDYEIEGQVIIKLCFTKTIIGTISVDLEGENGQIGSGWFYLPTEGAVEFTLDENGKTYTVKISATIDSEPVLTLTETGTKQKMYFSFWPLI